MLLVNDYEKKFNEEWNKYQSENKNKYPNIMLLGTSGAGKSSLINTVFGKEIAPVSDVRPETKGYDRIYMGEDYGSSVNLVDTAGYEIDQGEIYYSEIKKTISEGINGSSIHIIWYCIPVTNERVQKMDFDILQKLTTEESIRKRICIVFTKCDADTKNGDKAKILKEAVDKNLSFDIKSFETSTNKELGLELGDLIEWSASAIDDEDLRNNFIAAQMKDLGVKREYAEKIVGRSAAAAAAVGVTPIPFSDAALLVPVQVTMLGKIINIYGVSNLVNISTSVISDVIITNLGKSIVSSILKMIPIVGQIAGAVINGGVAAALTGAIGYAASELCYQNVNKFLKGQHVAWDNIFGSEEFLRLVKKNFNEKKSSM